MTQVKEGVVKFNRFRKALNFRKWSFCTFLSDSFLLIFILSSFLEEPILFLLSPLFFPFPPTVELGRKEGTQRVHFRCPYLCVEWPTFKI